MNLTYGDLKDQIGMQGVKDILLCQSCGNECSANAGDYWNRPKNVIISCECGGEFIIGHFVTKFIETKKAKVA